MSKEKMSRGLLGLVVAVTMAMTPFSVSAAEGLPTVTVYKSPTCGCCKDWVTHMESNGFTVKVFNVRDVTPYKRINGVTPELASCHTAVVDGYIIEGHVPAEDIVRLLKERPEVKGVSVPGMPVGSPGMEMGSRKDPYSVVTFDKAGNITVFARH